ncbi:hypothetical protein BH11ACT5_BH11ACT5_08270 [soil metagenome]
MDQTHAPEHIAQSGWKSFWERGAWWKAVLLVVAYVAVYVGISQLLGLLYGDHLGEPGSAQNNLLLYGLPILVGGIIPLTLFAWSVGWLKELFARQPIRGHWWMWIAVGVVLITNVLRFAAIDYSKAGFELVAAWLLSGLCVGIAEEGLTRGVVVNILRKAGYKEIIVAVVSAGLFALLHVTNLLGGQNLVATGIQVVYTFAFGVCMYLALRVTGNLIWPILLHASTDPSVFLMGYATPGSGLTAVASLGNFPVIIVGLILLIFVRGRVQRNADGLTSPTLAS